VDHDVGAIGDLGRQVEVYSAISTAAACGHSTRLS